MGDAATTTPGHPEPAADLTGPPIEPWLRAIAFALGGTSVASLLAWVFGLGSFHAWFRWVSVPGQLGLAAIGVVLVRRRDLDGLRTLLVAGAVGGVIGTVGYDLFRVPFVMGGMRVLAPIDSYGVLALAADGSSPLTGFAGWTYHFANGVGFGVAYAALAGRGRRWGWGVAWALLLETATVVTPFATQYALRGKWWPITVAYLAHIPYGMAIGYAVERPERFRADVQRITRHAVPASLAAVLVVLALWHRPFITPDLTRQARDVADGPSAVVQGGEFEPEWIHVPVGGCVVFRNLDDESWELNQGTPAVLPPRADTTVCFDDDGVHRVRTSDEPYAGGFVIVDPEL